MHLLAVEAVERGHHRLRAGGDRRYVAGGVDVAQLRFIDRGIALVLAVVGAAIAEEVLDRGHHVVVVEEVRRAGLALQALDEYAGVAGHQRRVFRIAFVGAAPAVVLRHRHGRREGPLHAGGAGLGGGDAGDLAQQFRVAGGAETDVVREQGGADHVALAVHGVDAPDDRDRLAAAAGIHRGFPERVGQRQPVLGRSVVLAAGVGAAAGQDRAEPVLAHVVRGDAGDVALHHLADLFLQRHRRHERVDAFLHRRVQRQRPGRLRPVRGVDAGRRRALRGRRGTDDGRAGQRQRDAKQEGAQPSTICAGAGMRKAGLHGRGSSWTGGLEERTIVQDTMTALSGECRITPVRDDGLLHSGTPHCG